jgi:hypothetical protein
MQIYARENREFYRLKLEENSLSLGGNNIWTGLLESAIKKQR